jgi:hypothetical protein
MHSAILAQPDLRGISGTRVVIGELSGSHAPKESIGANATEHTEICPRGERERIPRAKRRKRSVHEQDVESWLRERECLRGSSSRLKNCARENRGSMNSGTFLPRENFTF